MAPISSGSYQAPSADPEPTEAEEKPETDAFTVTIVDEAASEVEAALEAVTNATETDTDKTLIIYVYADSESALANLKFFLAHGMHGAADFVFVINGDTGTDVAGLVPKKDNVRVVERPNDCYDLGALAEVLTQGNLYQGYKKFITMNASIRGPFIPHWSEGCWSDMFLNKITDEVKVRCLSPSPVVSSRLSLIRNVAGRDLSKLLASLSHPIHDLGHRSRRNRDPALSPARSSRPTRR